jgi:hypothetical protein
MNDPARSHPLRTVILVGLLYFVAGSASIALAAAAGSGSMRQFWRWSAFVVSAVVFVGHIMQERRLRNTAWPTAWHVSAAVAFGAFALALGANLHDMGSAAGYRPRMVLALAAWPLLTAVPAFVVALAVAAGLATRKS